MYILNQVFIRFYHDKFRTTMMMEVEEDEGGGNNSVGSV